MSRAADQSTISLADLTDSERAYLVGWGDEQGLEVAMDPAGASSATGIVFIGYGEGIPAWSIYRAEGCLWLCDIDYRAGRQCEGSKMTVECVEQATDRILVDTEA